MQIENIYIHLYGIGGGSDQLGRPFAILLGVAQGRKKIMQWVVYECEGGGGICTEERWKGRVQARHYKIDLQIEFWRYKLNAEV